METWDQLLNATHPKRARFNHPKSGRSWPFAKRVDCTIATNDEQPEYRIRAHDFLVDRSACIHCICARSSARFSGSVRKFATRAARLVTAPRKTHQRATRNFR